MSGGDSGGGGDFGAGEFDEPGIDRHEVGSDEDELGGAVVEDEGSGEDFVVDAGEVLEAVVEASHVGGEGGDDADASGTGSEGGLRRGGGDEGEQKGHTEAKPELHRRILVRKEGTKRGCFQSG